MVRVRFAPSPTGALHLGGARTALYNWVFARRHKGTFILRIEDTDRQRSTLEAEKAIFEGLEWLGIDWDEGARMGGDLGPYFQTERLQIYRQYAEQLIKAGKAYHCFCTPEELERKRKEAEGRKEAPRYDGACRKLPPVSSSKPSVIRFTMPPLGETKVDDLIRGEVVFKNEVLDDFVIMKSDGFPTYNFACVVDDHLMEISHVIRGDDHLSNTPRQILLYQALGWKLPQFAHIPMIMGKDKARLSKRHGATSVVSYRDQGYLPEAMVNYLARLGWGYKDQEIFSREELVEKFSLEAVSKNPAIFDLDKLNWLNGQYIRTALPERVVDLCESYLIDAYQVKDLPYLGRVVRSLIDRLAVISDVVPLSEYFFKEDFQFDEKAADKYLKDPSARDILSSLKERLALVEPFVKEEIEKVFKNLAAELSVKLGVVIHPCRAALTGRAESPPMYDVVEILGKERVLRRLEKTISR